MPLGAMAIAHYVIDSAMVAGLTSFSRKRPYFQVWKQDYVWTSISFFGGASAAGLVYVLLRYLGVAGALVCAPVVALTYYSYRIYLGRVEKQVHALEEMSKVQLQTIEALVTAIEAKSQSSHGHLKSVQAMSVGLAEKLGVTDETMEGVRAAALLHEVGKLAVPDSILNKLDPLTEIEEKKVNTYPRIGAEILGQVKFPYDVAPLIRCLRERWDGEGVPEGLAGEAIPLGARIIGLADGVLTMLSSKPWRAALSEEETFRRVQGESGKKYDPKLVELLCENFTDLLQKAKAVELPDQSGLDEISTIHREHAAASAETREPKSVLGDIQAARRESIVLNDLARELSASQDLQGVLRVVMVTLRSLITFDTGVIYLLDENVTSLTACFADGANADLLRDRALQRDRGISGWVAANKTTKINADPCSDFTDSSPELRSAYASAAVVPLNDEKGLCVAVLTLYDSRPQHFTGENERILGAVAAQAGPAIRSASSYEESRRKALTDALTGLHNKRRLETELQAAVSGGAEGKSFGIVVIDLDRFKPINDTYGHQAGDAVLRAAAQALRKFFRGTDLVCRTGGDEFTVLMPEAKIAAVERAVHRAQQGIDELKIQAPGGHVVQVGMSAGWAVFPDDGATIEELTAVADKRMYENKARRHEEMGVPMR